MRNRFFQVFCVLSLAAAAAAAQNDLSSPVPTDPKVKIGKLPNGLTYYVRQNAKPENKVELRLVVNAGSILEREDQQGIAHFLEHMAFNGTKSFKKNDLISYLQSIGVQFGHGLNAYTTYDETVFILPIPTDKPENLDKGLQIMMEWAADITLDPAEIERERGVVLEELRLRSGAAHRMSERLRPKIYRGSRYAERNPIGKKEVLESFKHQAIVDFYEDWYRPDLMAVVAVGDLDAAEMENKIAASFSAIRPKRASKPRPEFSVSDNEEALMAVATDREAPVAEIQLSFKRRPEAVETLRDHRRRVAKSLFEHMVSMRLIDLSVSPNTPFIVARAGFMPLVRSKDSYTFYGVSDPKNIRPAISSFLSMSRRLRELGFTENELEDAKRMYLANLEKSYQQADKAESSIFANEIVQHFLQKQAMPGREFTYRFDKSVVPEITLSEIDSLAKETITKDNRLIVVTGPENNGVGNLTENEIVSLMKTAETAELKEDHDTGDAEVDISEAGTTAKTDEENNVTATVVEERTDPKLGITYWTLSNGVKVVLRPDAGDDQVVVRSFSPGGLSMVDDSKPLARDFAAMMWGEGGIMSQPKEQNENARTRNYPSVDVSISESHEYIRGDSTPEDLEQLLEQVQRPFKRDKLEKTSFNSFIGLLRTINAARSADPHEYFREQVERTMIQDHRRAISVPATEQLDKISLDDVNTIYSGRFGDASDFTFVFTGKFENERVKPLILQYLGSLPVKSSAESWKDHGIRPPSGKVERVFRKGIEQKSFVRIAFTGEEGYDVFDNQLLSMLGDLVTIKLLEVLREEKSGVYTVEASGGMLKVPYDRFEFAIEFPCGPESVNVLIDAAIAEIEKIRGGQVNDHDLDKVKRAKLLNAVERTRSGRYWANQIMASLRDGTAIESPVEFEKRISSVTKADIERAANKYLNVDQRKQFVLMPETSEGKNSAN